MPKELSDHAAADLWRQLSQLIDEGGNLTFEHTASGRTGEVIQCHLIPGKPSSICSNRSGIKRWSFSGRSILECLRGVLERREVRTMNNRTHWLTALLGAVIVGAFLFIGGVWAQEAPVYGGPHISNPAPRKASANPRGVLPQAARRDMSPQRHDVYPGTVERDGTVKTVPRALCTARTRSPNRLPSGS